MREHVRERTKETTCRVNSPVRVRDVLVKWSGGLPLEVRFRFCCVRWWWIQSRFRTDGYSCMLGLLCFLLDSVGWVPMRSSGFHFQVDEVANTGSLIKLDLSILSRQVIDVVITVVFLHLTTLSFARYDLLFTTNS
ncbi:hypothetical protein YC2023_080820 [Brassica napus]